MRAVVLGVLSIGLAAAGAGCASARAPLSPATAARPSVTALDLGIANAYVVYGRRPILIDSGTADETDRLTKALRGLGIKPGELAAIVLTHGHGDHGGGAKPIRDQWGAPIVAGAGDVAMLASGHNRTLHPTSLTARMLRPFIDRAFPPYAPDVVVTKEIDLRPYGVDGRIIPAPGHTPGSQAVLLDDGDAFAGDMLLGGYLGGAMSPGTPGRHYYHDDTLAAETQICRVVRAGARRLYVGHGGPIAAADAWKRFCSVGDDDVLPTPPALARPGP